VLAAALGALLGTAWLAQAHEFEGLPKEGDPGPQKHELALLPEWCLYHPSVNRILKRGDRSLPHHPLLDRIVGSGCHAIQHYCWALVQEVRGNRESEYRARGKQYYYAIGNIDYTLDGSPDSCILMAVMHAKKGNLYSKLGDHKKAVELYRQAIARDPKYELAYSGLCAVYLRQEQYDEALQALRAGLAANPKSLLLKKHLADLEARRATPQQNADAPPAGD